MSFPYIRAREAHVSVPLRGLWFLSLSTVFTAIISLSASFRPLAGIMVLIEATEETEDWLKPESFRPLAGIMVLIRKKRSLIGY